MDDAAKRLIYERNSVGTPRRGPRGSLGSSSDPEGRRIILERNRRRGARGLSAAVYSPSEIKAEADTTNTILTQLYQDAVASPKIPQKIRYSFYAFLNEWVDFYKNHTSWFDRLWFSNLEKITDYRTRGEAWRKKLEKNGLVTTAPADNVPQPGFSLPDGALAKLGIAAAVLVGLFIAGKLVHTIMFGQTALGEAEEAAVSIAQAKRRKRHARRVLSIS